MTKKHLALTLGPLTRTLEATRSTRALWSASYMFSYIMREIVKKLRDSEGVKFIAPFNGNTTKQDFCDQNELAVGLFHDRLIFESSSLGLSDLNQVINTVLSDLANKISKIGYDDKKITTYLSQYLQFHTLEVDADILLDDINAILDTLECQTVMMPAESEAYLVEFFEYLENSKYNEFVETEFPEDKRFPSTAEIATADLKKQSNYGVAVAKLRAEEKALFSSQEKERNSERRKLKWNKHIDTQIVFYDLISEFPSARQRHKYMAIVQADGDRMGGFINAINAYYTQHEPTKPQSERFLAFSEQLMTFAYEATQKIKDFGATPIYSGGDDLLFFSPLVGTKGKSLLDLMQEVDDVFAQKIADFPDFIKFFDFEIKGKKTLKPTMSYGVAINYYKFPLGEAKKRSVEMLFNKAKTGDKNKLAFEVQKHAGQQFGGVLERGKISYSLFNDLINNRLKKTDESNKFINSIGHKLQSFEGLLKGIAKEGNIGDRLKSFFKNNFDEAIHKSNKDYLDKVCDFIIAILEETKWQELKDKKEFEEKMHSEMERIYGALRFVHFLEADFKDENDSSFTQTENQENA